jgi:hypothetical protein
MKLDEPTEEEWKRAVFTDEIKSSRVSLSVKELVYIFLQKDPCPYIWVLESGVLVRGRWSSSIEPGKKLLGKGYYHHIQDE